HYKPLRAQVKRLRFLNLTAMYRALFSDPSFAARFAPGVLPAEWDAICAQTVERIDRGELAFEDATPFLDLKERIEGFQTNTKVRHLFLDEAQDYSPFQMAFLKRLFPFARMTVLGDANQAIFAHTDSGAGSGTNGFAALASLFNEEETQTIVLTRSYRSTRPIIELTSRLIPGGEAIEPFNREGRLPTMTQAVDMADLTAMITARIAEMQEAGHQSIAVICKTAEESQRAYVALKEQLALRLIGKETVSFEQGVVVIPSYLAKGVEFDAVILYDASDAVYGRESERKLFYTACTRAMHELHIYYVGELTPFLASLQ
ncbi:MAG: RNA polymerase recycling motor HelD, partial [Tumebacillaceae bacterium]